MGTAERVALDKGPGASGLINTGQARFLQDWASQTMQVRELPTTQVASYA